MTQTGGMIHHDSLHGAISLGIRVQSGGGKPQTHHDPLHHDSLHDVFREYGCPQANFIYALHIWPYHRRLHMLDRIPDSPYMRGENCS